MVDKSGGAANTPVPYLLHEERKMKRSEVNALIEEVKELLSVNNIRLPPFAYWSPKEWETKGAEANEIRACKLGWDLSDFGEGKFSELGLTLFTVRNGHNSEAPYNQKTYCEKFLIVGENQITPMHYHKLKTEDIIVRAGGHLVVVCHHRSEDDGLGDVPIRVSCDGVARDLKAGEEMVLTQGESVTLPPYLYHAFWAEAGTGTSIVGEVSKVNDDENDNFFFDPIGRFPDIEEDAPPVHLLCTEY